MTTWSHPDRLDRISASGNHGHPTIRASVDDVVDVLGRVLGTGALRRVPKKVRDRDIVLAVLCLTLRRRHAYTEQQLNEHLEAALARMNALVDYVTCRRCLVDLGFVKRDRAGARYMLNPARLEATVSVDALGAAGALLQQVLKKKGARVPIHPTERLDD